ncbi:hypothetical protein GH714_018021 [Hevea brasiliensis]|uniref:Alkyl transferase n=1 Tax=Hevea brasiliensis TaxID=3981 RepID=A0A6A6MER5_HEVBR|nr:hypothetical protein GH714_018021 [Hevea brasiliensis]
MELYNGERPSVFRLLGKYMRKGLYGILTQGPIPTHLAFILDGNRRFAKKHKLPEGGGHKAGFLALLNVLTYCYELGVKYATIYAFSIDNFRRKPHEVQYVMDLMLEKIDGMIKEESIINAYDICVRFVGNLKLLKLEEANATGSSTVIQTENMESYSGIKLVDLEKNTYINPYPDVLIRTSGETRLSNYLLWQTTNCILYSPYALWPEIGLRHVVWSVINFQRHYSYLEKHKEYLK